MVISFVGMSSSGKSAIGQGLCRRLKSTHPNTVLVDGDALRAAIAPDLQYTFEDRRESEARRSKLCKFLSDQDIHVICTGLSNYPEWREWCRAHIQDYCEIYLDVPMAILHKRDSKGIYDRALRGEIEHVVGVDIEFRPPADPDLVIENTGKDSVDEIVDHILSYTSEHFNFPAASTGSDR